MKNYTYYRIDWITVFIYITLVTFGWASLYSNNYDASTVDLLSFDTVVGKQLFFIIVSIITAGFILLLDGSFITRVAYLIYFISIIGLVLVLFIGIEVGGAKAWIDFGRFNFQPAEFAKYGTILAIAKYMNDKNVYLETPKILIIIMLFILFPCMLILKQPDAGSALVYLSLIIMFFREGFPFQYVLIIIVIGVLSLLAIIIGISKSVFFLMGITMILAYLLKKHRKQVVFAVVFFIFGALIISTVDYSYKNILKPHQKERIDNLIGKEKNTLGSGYNLNQSLIAIGSGGFSGKGYLKGPQTKFNFVPEQNTDFIFCTIGEEWGFLGSIIIIILFMSLIIRILFLSEKQTSRFSRIIGYSSASIIFGHVLINLGMTLGLIPIIGIPLPFFSYGGSSLLSFSILLFTFIKLDTYRMERF